MDTPTKREGSEDVADTLAEQVATRVEDLTAGLREPEWVTLSRRVVEHGDRLREMIDECVGMNRWDDVQRLEEALRELNRVSGDKPPSMTKLRAIVDGRRRAARDAVLVYLQNRRGNEHERKVAAGVRVRAEWLLRELRGGPTPDLEVERRKIMTEISDGIGNTSRGRKNIATRIVRRH